MKKIIRNVGLLALVFVSITSCTTLSRNMREPNTLLNLEKSDFTLSAQVSAEASTTKILGIDIARLFTKTNGTTTGGQNITAASIPIIGGLISDKTEGYALYELMEANPGFDVVLYPQYEKRVVKPMGLGFLIKNTTVKAKARLGKLNK